MKTSKGKHLEWEAFGHLFKREEYQAGTLLLREGQVSRKAYLIEKGCCRLWFNNNGKDVSFQFFFEGQAISSAESFRNNQPSQFSIETIEPCVMFTISKKDFQLMVDTSPAFKADVEENIFQRLLLYQQLFLSRIKDSPEKRYHDLLANHPEMLQRIPQHYIASYLGITSVSLSRIRNRRAH